jgi:hypothetical protein
MKKHFTSILCLALAGTMLTACDTSDPGTTEASGTSAAVTILSTAASGTSAETAASETTADTTASAAETAAGTTVLSAVTTSAAAASTAADTSAVSAKTAQPGDMAAAKSAAEQFLSALGKNDRDTVTQFSDMGEIIKMIRSLAETQKDKVSEEEIQKQIDEYFEDASKAFKLQQPTLGDGTVPEQFIAFYNDAVAEERGLIEKDTPEIAKAADVLMQPIGTAYAFPISGTTKHLIVKQDGDNWKVMLMADTMMGYIKKSKLTRSNRTAKSLYQTFNVAMVELEENENADLKAFDGIHTFKGSDLQNVDSKGGKGMDAMLTYALKYFPEMKDFEEFSVRLEGGQCKAAAVKLKNNAFFDLDTNSFKDVFGEYPQPLTADTTPDHTDTKELVTNIQLN